MAVYNNGRQPDNRPTTVYEVLVHLRTKEVWGVRYEYGSVTGTVDLTDEASAVSSETLPRTEDLPTLEYYPPLPEDHERLAADSRDWLVVRRFTHFEPAAPPQWVLDRQAVTRRNTFDGPVKTAEGLDF